MGGFMWKVRYICADKTETWRTYKSKPEAQVRAIANSMRKYGMIWVQMFQADQHLN